MTPHIAVKKGKTSVFFSHTKKPAIRMELYIHYVIFHLNCRFSNTAVLFLLSQYHLNQSFI